MTTTSPATPRSADSPPTDRPDRDVMVERVLSFTKRKVVPIRRVFLQTPLGTTAADGTRRSLLSEFARDTTTLDCYLWIAALASARASEEDGTYSAEYPAATWAQLAGLVAHAELDAAKTRWSKAVTRLVGLKLIERQRKGGKNQASYLLLHEDGSGTLYSRPTTKDHGNWFTIPHNYWLEGWDLKLSGPEKLMLLIALDQQDGFDISPERVPDWYGLSRNTAQRGYKGLVAHGILDAHATWVAEPKSPNGWKKVVRYTTVGPWARAARLKAGRSRKLVPSGIDTG